MQCEDVMEQQCAGFVWKLLGTNRSWQHRSGRRDLGSTVYSSYDLQMLSIANQQRSNAMSWGVPQPEFMALIFPLCLHMLRSVSLSATKNHWSLTLCAAALFKKRNAWQAASWAASPKEGLLTTVTITWTWEQTNRTAVLLTVIPIYSLLNKTSNQQKLTNRNLMPEMSKTAFYQKHSLS